MNSSLARDDASLFQGVNDQCESTNRRPGANDSCGISEGESRAIFLENLMSYDNLYDAMLKCSRGVTWKPSVKFFLLKAPQEIEKMHNDILSGKWKNGTPRKIQIVYPKRREGMAISFKDRIYQRVLNDLILYPCMTKHFIRDNCACQKGKGYDYAHNRLKKQLWQHYCKYGYTGYIVQIDVHQYYQSMRHDEVKACFAKYVPAKAQQLIFDVLDQQYQGNVGYFPGSQMVQIAGISFLNEVDHYIKEILKVQHYLRYMDDFHLIAPTKEKALLWVKEIKAQLENLGLTISEKKTRIIPISQSWVFLGIRYTMDPDGAVHTKLTSQNIRHEKRKLKKMINRAKNGLMTKEKVDECYTSWKAHANKTTCKETIIKMDEYYTKLWETV